ncbi:hypothetical protein QSV37_08230 [Acinetobacter sp. VNK23]|uniref:hypothetical protein n=1 Tax=Acinetobacter thutiue TaxID=2998078 RepID=UPI0025783D47|nr:hypothetical protein [Acinetobacter thutiue]MDM1020292.1 hypothetical protein [Acinetobacter thutiue]
MKQYLRIAEEIYDSFYAENKFTSNTSDCLKLLIKAIRKELIGTEMKLIYNGIDFEKGYKKTIQDGQGNLDISLIPNAKNHDEFILWLAGFIERITVGGVRNPPAIKRNIPPEFSYDPQAQDVLTKFNHKTHTEQMISTLANDGFSSDYKRLN